MAPHQRHRTQRAATRHDLIIARRRLRAIGRDPAALLAGPALSARLAALGLDSHAPTTQHRATLETPKD